MVKDLAKSKTGVSAAGLILGLLIAGSYARRQAAGKGKAEEREPDLSRFPADE